MNLQEARNILGVGPNASKDEIKKAYRRLAMNWHPDKQPEEKKKEASEKFAKISTAHDILSNPQKAQQSHFSGFNQSRQWYQERKRKYNPMRSGEHVYTSTKITLEEAVRGVSKKIKINRPVVCDSCDGNGMKKGRERTECASCNGTGIVTIRQKIMGAEFNARHNCPTCQGVGSIIEPKDACDKCRGKKTINKYEDVTIEIPSGVRNGMKLGANELGGQGIAGGANGRLFIDIMVEDHEHYKTIEDSDDLRLNYNISYGQHYHGDAVEIQTIYGDKIEIKIPPCHDTINPIIKDGYGLPSLPDSIRRMTLSEKGDLYIYLNVKGPKEEKESMMESLNYRVENPIENYK